ncbi:outer membrane protein TolC [Edaphobacter modestus]|uniref:Outer membrane protein TolC n=2 Tax=Edaphobacter modestus TaxID=388466 RepID=A0A4Q7YSI4_9BACT|nr:outer membrane protein TolC [Edaphobacter modestus]
MTSVAQKAPASPDRPWSPPSGAPVNTRGAGTNAPVLDPSEVYTLPELINLAEENNPETRVAWQNARARAAEVGIAEAELYPALAATAIAQSARNNVFFAPNFYRQTTETFSPTLSLDYVVFDFGRRTQRIAISKSKLLAANFLFNDTHRKVIFQVMQAYYRFLNSKGQEEAAEATLKNAQTVQDAAEARLQTGLATLPDVLEARSAVAQADYDLQAAFGATEIAHGDLATSMGISPTAPFQVESIQNLTIPEDLTETVESSIDKALAQRPDLMQRVQSLRGAESVVKLAKRDYLPSLRVGGAAGLAKTYGQQNQMPGIYSPNQELWNARLSLTWNLFDGFARENRLARAKADQNQAAAELKALQDRVENQVWAAYSTAHTALRQQRAAAALLAASTESYNAALQSYSYGVRNQIDVVSAQRSLAVARTADVNARTQLLMGVAALAFETGNLLYAKGP